MPSAGLKQPKSKAVAIKPRPQIQKLFDELGWRPFGFQKSAWRAYANGCNGLIHSATGTGKTLAAWLGPLMEWMHENPGASLWNHQRPPEIQVLWVTPLRALAADTEAALRMPIEKLGLPWRLERRTGDTSAYAKGRQLKKLPTALVTTPESLTLLLTHEKLLDQFRSLRTVVVDEWHELLGTKRGIQTELALARLRALNPGIRTWGLSATLGNLDAAQAALFGNDSRKESKLIEGYRKKKLSIESLLPQKIERFPWSGHIGTRLAQPASKLIEDVSSALVFTNTRSQTEIWYQALLKARPEWAGAIALHHGSLDTTVRRWVEDGLRSGKLRAVVCTSSLDLGVDFTAVDLVLQVGSPKGVARLLQRAGRSGHQPRATSRLRFVPTNALELIELAAAKDSIKARRLESRLLLRKPLDVLAQHVVTVAIGGGFEAETLYQEVRSTAAYRDVTTEEWQWVLDFVCHGGTSLRAYPDFKRVDQVDGIYRVTDKRTIRKHRMNIGTIASDASMLVKYQSGRALGTIEETFIAKLKEGDKFLFAGRLVALQRVYNNAAYVKRASGTPDAIPRWMGGRMPLSSELSDALRQKIQEASEGVLKGPEMRELQPIFELQARWSVLPRCDELLMERVKTRDGYQLFVFPFEGRLVHEGLSALLAYRLARGRKLTITMACNDHGLVIQSRSPLPLEQCLVAGLFATDNLLSDIQASLNATEMTKRQFRQIARVAGLIQSGYPGEQKTARHLQASSNLFFEVFTKYDSQNLLLRQAEREVLEQQLEFSRLHRVLVRIAASKLVITDPARVTPLAFPLLVDKLRERLSNESLLERVAKLQQQLEQAADEGS